VNRDEGQSGYGDEAGAVYIRGRTDFIPQGISRRGYPAGEQILRRGEEIDILPIEIWEEIDMVPS